jgi:hypothetical protein
MLAAFELLGIGTREAFGDAVVAITLIDQLLHHAIASRLRVEAVGQSLSVSPGNPETAAASAQGRQGSLLQGLGLMAQTTNGPGWLGLQRKLRWVPARGPDSVPRRNWNGQSQPFHRDDYRTGD